jgi:hypothetical protein
MTNTAIKNTSSYAKSVIELANGEEKANHGPLSLILDYEADMETFARKMVFASNAGIDASSSARDFLASQPEGHKLIAARDALKGKRTARQEMDHADYSARIRKSENYLIRTAKVMNVMLQLKENGMTLSIMKPRAGGARYELKVLSGIKGKSGEREELWLSSRTLEQLSGEKLKGIVSPLDLPTGKAKSANDSKGNNGERIAPSKLGDAIRSVDTTVAGFDLAAKDNGLPPAAVMSMALLWARLDSELSADIKSKARAQYNAEADDAAIAAKTA